MRKLLCLTSIVFFSMVSTGFCESLLDGWIQYNSPLGKYSVLLPKAPVTSNDATHSTISDGKYFQTNVQWFDVPGFSMERGRDGFVNGLKGTLIEERRITFSGNPGYEWRVQTFVDNADTIFLARTFKVNERTYLLQFWSPKSNFEDPVITDCAKKYFDSFVTK